MKRIFILTILAATATFTRAKVDLSTLPTRDTVQLTIYNSADLTLVRDSRALTLEAVQRKLISDTLEMTGGRKIAAAKILGIERRRLNRMIKKLNIAIDKLENDMSS